ncbi:YqgE/AlgH family protein [Pyxidicoccus sp. 3LFB2]
MKGLARRHLVVLLACALLMLVALPRLIAGLKEAEEAAPQTPAPGLLLVARPDRVSGMFDKTVVLLVETGGERTWGLVLNRARLPPAKGADRWGGPVHPEHRITLVREDAAPEGARRVVDGLAWYEGARGVGDGSLTFAGMAAWGPGQLEEELAQGAWWLVEGSARAVFTAPEASWAEHAARRL